MYRLKRENEIGNNGEAKVIADKYKTFVGIDGKSTQETRSGINYFDTSKIANANISVLDNGKTIKMPIATSGNGYTNTNSKLSVLCPNLKVGDTVYLLGETTSSGNKYAYLDTPTSALWYFGMSKTITENDLNSYLVLYGNRFSSGETEQVTISNLRIVKNVSEEWEQYGASPSPEFPSEIKSVGDEGTLNIEQEGKNKLKNSSFTQDLTDWGKEGSGTGSLEISEKFNKKCLHIAGELQKAKYVYQDVKDRVEKGKTYTVSCMAYLENFVPGTTNSFVAIYTDGTNTSGKWSSGFTRIDGFNNFNNENYDYSKGFTKITAKLKVLDDVDLSKKVGVFIYARDFTGDLYVYDFQLEESTEATEYEEYFHKEYTLPLSEPLRSLPNGVKDTLEEDGIHRRVESVVLDGSEDWKIRTDYSYENYTVFRNGSYNSTTYKLITNGYGLSNYFNIKQSQVEENHIRFLNTNGYGTQITISNNIASTVEEFKTWLSENPITVIYELAEEVIEPYTDEQKQIISSMVTEKGTNIFKINEDTGIEIDYVPELTDEVKHAFKYGITRGYLEVLSTGLIINEDSYLQSMDFDDERYVDSEGIIGTTVAKSLEGKFINVDSEFDIENEELQAYIGAELDDGTVKYIDLGTFIVQKPDNDNVKDNTSFNALDYMVKFNQTYKDTIEYPCTLGQLLENVCGQVEITLGTKTFRNSSFLVENNQFVNNESCREVVKAIAQMAFSWARINQDNELVLDFDLIDEPTEEIDYNEYYDLTSNNEYGPVNTIILKNSQVEGENYTIIDPNKKETDKTCAITISDNPFAYTQAKRSQLIQAGKALYGFRYIPFTTKTIGYVYLNCKDKIRLKNMQDKLLDSYIFNNKITYEGTISDSKETSAMTETETKYQFTDTTENKINAKIAKTEVIVDKANQEITAIAEKQTEYDKDLAKITVNLNGITSEVNNIKDFKRTKQATNEIYIDNAMEDGTLSFTAIGNESVNIILYPLDNLYPSDDLYGGNQFDG